MNLSKVSKTILVGAIFLIATIMLYVAYEKTYIPFIIFIIGFGLVILICVYIMMSKPTKREWKELRVIPVKRKK